MFRALDSLVGKGLWEERASNDVLHQASNSNQKERINGRRGSEPEVGKVKNHSLREGRCWIKRKGRRVLGNFLLQNLNIKADKLWGFQGYDAKNMKCGGND